MGNKKQICIHGISPKGDCKPCRSEYMREFRRSKYITRKRVKLRDRRQADRKKAINFLGGKCMDCGSDDERVLVFDHIEKKTCNVARLLGKSWKRIEDELRKCELVCANCHQIRTISRIPVSVDLFTPTYRKLSAVRFDSSASCTIDGISRTIKEWAGHYNIAVATVAQRVTSNHWDIVRALITPKRKW